MKWHEDAFGHGHFFRAHCEVPAVFTLDCTNGSFDSYRGVAHLGHSPSNAELPNEGVSWVS